MEIIPGFWINLWKMLHEGKSNIFKNGSIIKSEKLGCKRMQNLAFGFATMVYT